MHSLINDELKLVLLFHRLSAVLIQVFVDLSYLRGEVVLDVVDLLVDLLEVFVFYCFL